MHVSVGLLRAWGRDSYDCPTRELVMAGSLTGTISLLSGYPFDLIKTRIQSLPPSTNVQNALRIAESIWKERGWKGFWKGAGVQLIKSIPGNALFFVVYAWSMHRMTL